MKTILYLFLITFFSVNYVVAQEDAEVPEDVATETTENAEEPAANDSLATDTGAIITMLAAISHEYNYSVNRFPGEQAWQDFTGSMMSKVMRGEHPAFDVETLDTLDMEYLNSLFGLGTDTLRYEDPNTGEERIETHPRQGFEPNQMNMVLVEKWVLDTAGSKMTKEVIAFIPFVTYDSEIDPSLQNYVTEYLFIAFFGDKPKEMEPLEGIIDYPRREDQQGF